MTFPRDKFPGFCWLAIEFTKRTSYYWKAGVEDFRRGLLWARGWWGRISWDFSPSWSWAALQPARSSDAMDYPYKPDSGQWTYLDCMEVDVIEVVVKTIDGNPFGQVVSASITLRGLSQPLGALWKVKNLHFNPEWKKTLPSTEDICVFMDFDQTPPQLLEKGRDIFYCKWHDSIHIRTLML
jgi:hypothetical protein